MGLLARTTQATAAPAEASGSGRIATAASPIWPGGSIGRSPARGRVSSQQRHTTAPCPRIAGSSFSGQGGIEGARRAAVCAEPKRSRQSYRPGEFHRCPLSASGESLRSRDHDSGREFAPGRRRRKQSVDVEPRLGPAGADIGAPARGPALRIAQRDPALRARVCASRRRTRPRGECRPPPVASASPAVHRRRHRLRPGVDRWRLLEHRT